MRIQFTKMQGAGNDFVVLAQKLLSNEYQSFNDAQCK